MWVCVFIEELNMSERISVVRKFLLWWFSPPNSPWVNVNITVDFSNAQRYLNSLAEDVEAPKVTVHHLLCSCIAKGLLKVPQANARIVGGKIIPQKHIGIAMPVNLLGHKGGGSRELSMLLFEDIGNKNLRELAEEGRKNLKKERSGTTTNPFLDRLLKLTELAPSSVVGRALDGLDRMMSHPRFAQKIYDQFPVTTALSNPGAALPSDVDGLLFRSCSVQIPNRLIHVGTFYAASAIQNEVIPINGKPEVRPMLPLMMLFDHRLIDGMKGSALLIEIARCIQNPESVFGPNGRVPPQASSE
jgi:pyruvate/2-oxoglutarate dehydrogenase complex dihydrolipoamide acyltransferase (E2) component